VIPHSAWKPVKSAGKNMVPDIDRISARQTMKTKDAGLIDIAGEMIPF
jgi:hypothetical protein